MAASTARSASSRYQVQVPPVMLTRPLWLTSMMWFSWPLSLSCTEDTDVQGDKTSHSLADAVLLSS